MTRSHFPAFSVWRINPRRCDAQVYRKEASSSLAMSSAILFSNPSSRSLENGRLSGSAHTRNSRSSAAASPADNRTARASASRTIRSEPSAVRVMSPPVAGPIRPATDVRLPPLMLISRSRVRLGKLEHVHGTARGRELGKILGGGCDSECRVRIVRCEAARNNGADIAPDSRVDGDALLAVGTNEGHRAPDDARWQLRLEQQPPRSGIDRLERPVHRAVEHQVTGRGEDSAIYWETLPDSPDLLSGSRIPRNQLPAVAARARVYRRACADERRTLDEVDLDRLVVHAEVDGGDVEQARDG